VCFKEAKVEQVKKEEVKKEEPAAEKPKVEDATESDDDMPELENAENVAEGEGKEGGNERTRETSLGLHLFFFLFFLRGVETNKKTISVSRSNFSFAPTPSLLSVFCFFFAISAFFLLLSSPL
jgi:hypothetical protein